VAIDRSEFRFKDGVELSSGGDKISTKSEGEKHSLTIGNAQQSDSGEYKITASSSGGRLSCTASLLVTGTVIHAARNLFCEQLTT